uniref:WAP domain-containing protein n=1 Tax=Homalodisca liturata TaxID=320908 RepID=A0A1B6H551_9HEMI
MDGVVWAVLVLLCAALATAQEPSENTVSGDDDDDCGTLEDYDGIACKSHEECYTLGQQCCGPDGKKTCRKTGLKTMPEEKHAPFLGLIPRECPRDPLPEPFPIRNCTSDADCWPRLCCPDGNRRFCRTALPLWDQLPAQRLFMPVRNMLAYLQCTPPPPPIYDLFPKVCRSTLDCFPNLCCQEQDRRVCRPPKKSVLALLATLGQRQRRGEWFG